MFKLWYKVKRKIFIGSYWKNFHGLNKTRPGTDNEWIEQTISIKTDFKKKTENQCQNTACEQKTISEKWKFVSNKKLGLEWTMNGLGNFCNSIPVKHNIDN